MLMLAGVGRVGRGPGASNPSGVWKPRGVWHLVAFEMRESVHMYIKLRFSCVSCSDDV